MESTENCMGTTNKGCVPDGGKPCLQALMSGNPSDFYITDPLIPVVKTLEKLVSLEKFEKKRGSKFKPYSGWGEPYRLHFSFICCPITTKFGMIVLWHKISQGK